MLCKGIFLLQAETREGFDSPVLPAGVGWGGGVLIRVHSTPLRKRLVRVHVFSKPISSSPLISDSTNTHVISHQKSHTNATWTN